jgi:hypothetical protein
MSSKAAMEVILNGVEDQLPALLENVAVLEKEVVILNGYECGEITYTFTEQSVTYKQKQLYYYNKTFLIIIGYLAKPDIFDTYYSDFNTIQNSIVLTD